MGCGCSATDYTSSSSSKYAVHEQRIQEAREKQRIVPVVEDRSITESIRGEAIQRWYERSVSDFGKWSGTNPSHGSTPHEALAHHGVGVGAFANASMDSYPGGISSSSYNSMSRSTNAQSPASFYHLTRKERAQIALQEQIEMQQLAVGLGRNPKTGKPEECGGYLPTTVDISRSDGSKESLILKRVSEMEQEDCMNSDGRLTPEPGEFVENVTKSFSTVRARMACKEHETDVEELEYISTPCPPDIRMKCHEWDGVYSILVPGALGPTLEPVEPEFGELESSRVGGATGTESPRRPSRDETSPPPTAKHSMTSHRDSETGERRGQPAKPRGKGWTDESCP
jgi:hypothetical protein